jgi:cysteine synthase
MSTQYTLIERLNSRGLYPKKQMLDNEISKPYEKAIEKYGMDVERVPKEAHRCNAAEKAIQTAKNHLKAI